MDEMMKKRIIGAAVLVLLGVSIPVLVSRCSGSSVGGQKGAMRVYEISPDGKTQAMTSDRAADVASTGDSQPGGAGGRNAQDGHRPQTAAPDSASRTAASAADNGAFSTPPVHGNGAHGADDTAAAPQPSSPTSGSRSEARGKASNRNGDRGRTPSAHSESTAPSKPAASASSSGSPAAGGWAVQVASFGDADNAKQLASQLKSRFDKAHYRAGDVKGKTYYRVLIGPFPSEDAARRAAAQLRDQGRKPLVRHLP